MFAFFGLFCGCTGAVAVLMVGAGLLRVAVSFTNRIVKPARAAEGARSGGIAEWDWDEWDDEPDRTDFEMERPWRAQPAVPEPGTFRSMMIMFATALVFVIGYILTGAFVAEMGFRMWRDDTQLAVTILNLPVAALALTTLLVMFLPTGFWRAAMVTFVYGLVVLAFALFIALTVLIVGAVF